MVEEAEMTRRNISIVVAFGFATLTADPTAWCQGAANKVKGPNRSDADNVTAVMKRDLQGPKEDLKTIMDGVKDINKNKDGLRNTQDQVNQLKAGSPESSDRTKKRPQG